MAPSKKYIHEFWAVTRNSLYWVVDQHKDKKPPIVRKIRDTAGSESELEVGKEVCVNDAPDGLVGITGYKGLVLYSPYEGRRAEEVNPYFHKARTSLIVAIFLRFEDALECLRSPDKIPKDPRWRKETLATLAVIGDDHPVFVPSKGHIWELAHE